MTLTEMLAQKKRLIEENYKAGVDLESIFVEERVRHDKEMARLTKIAGPLFGAQEKAKLNLEEFNEILFGEMVIDTSHPEWRMTVYRAGSGREWYSSLGWYRVMSNGNDCWWTLDIRFSKTDKNYKESHIYSQHKFGPGRLPNMPTSYREEGRGFMDHLPKVREAFAAAGVVLIDSEG